MPWECLGPHPGGDGGSGWGVSRPTPGGSRPTPGGGAPGPGPWGGVPACTQPDTPPPPQHAATAPGGTHPTGMHLVFEINLILKTHDIQTLTDRECCFLYAMKVFIASS